jgi:hypothetical protein
VLKANTFFVLTDIIWTAVYTLLRVSGEKSLTFQAFAHMFVAYLFCMGFVNVTLQKNWYRIILAVFLCVVELYSFFVLFPR